MLRNLLRRWTLPIDQLNLLRGQGGNGARPATADLDRILTLFSLWHGIIQTHTGLGAQPCPRGKAPREEERGRNFPRWGISCRRGKAHAGTESGEVCGGDAPVASRFGAGGSGVRRLDIRRLAGWTSGLAGLWLVVPVPPVSGLCPLFGVGRVPVSPVSSHCLPLPLPWTGYPPASCRREAVPGPPWQCGDRRAGLPPWVVSPPLWLCPCAAAAITRQRRPPGVCPPCAPVVSRRRRVGVGIPSRPPPPRPSETGRRAASIGARGCRGAPTGALRPRVGRHRGACDAARIAIPDPGLPRRHRAGKIGV